MPGPGVAGLIIAMRERVAMERRQEMKRAVALHQSDPRRSAYHLGLADGKNGIVKELTDILNSASISKGENRNESDRRSAAVSQ